MKSYSGTARSSRCYNKLLTPSPALECETVRCAHCVCLLRLPCMTVCCSGFSELHFQSYRHLDKLLQCACIINVCCWLVLQSQHILGYISCAYVAQKLKDGSHRLHISINELISVVSNGGCVAGCLLLQVISMPCPRGPHQLESQPSLTLICLSDSCVTVACLSLSCSWV